VSQPAHDITYLRPTDAAPQPRVPTFDGQTVDRYEVKISGVATLDDDQHEVPLVSLDDRVRVVGGYRVTKVNHYVDDKTGEIVRQATLSPMSAEVCKWDPTDPNDDGVVRAPKG
jgi:hypothetical protein